MTEQESREGLPTLSPMARTMLPIWRTTADKAGVTLARLVELNQAETDAAAEASAAAYARSRTVLLIAAALSILVGLGTALFLARSISSGVGQVAGAARKLAGEDLPALVEAARALADGDLSKDVAIETEHVKVTSRDEIGVLAAQDMSVRGREVSEAMGGIAAVASSATAATEEMLATASGTGQSVEEIASIATESSATFQEVSASTEEMGAQVEEVSAQAIALAETAKELLALVARFRLEAVDALYEAEYDDWDDSEDAAPSLRRAS